MNRDAFNSFMFVSGRLFGSGDLDPLYPYLRNLLSGRGTTDMDDRLWFVQLYHAFYRVDTAWRFWAAVPKREDLVAGAVFVGVGPGVGNWPIATERRNLRQSSRLNEHLGELTKANLVWWIDRGAKLWQPVEWQAVYDAALALKHNGPWAAFKWTDLARYVLGWDLTPTPPSVASGAGPELGLKLLETNLEELGAALATEGVTMPWDQIETCLCKWHGVETGHYKIYQDLKELEHQTAPIPELAAVFARTNFSLNSPVRP